LSGTKQHCKGKIEVIMIKTAAAIFFALVSTTLWSQNDSLRLLLDSARNMLTSVYNNPEIDFGTYDYGQVVTLLERVIKKAPNNAEAYYLMGCTYGRINSRDGRSLIYMGQELLNKTSEYFEKAIEIEPEFDRNHILVLDPYSKLSSEWGAMAARFMYLNMPDSAARAFSEGKRRGGFGDFHLELARKILDVCSENAILISSGDISTFPLWYLQSAENYRTDVAVVDVSLLNTVWFPEYLSVNGIVAFDIPPEELDSTYWIPWSDSTVTIEGFSWTIRPTAYDQFLSRGDLLMLSLLRANRFQRDVYFSEGFDDKYKLSLTNHLSPMVVVEMLSKSGVRTLTHEEYMRTIIGVLELSEYLNMQSYDERRRYDGLRYNLLRRAWDHYVEKDFDRLELLMQILERYADYRAIPYLEDNGESIIEFFGQELLEHYQSFSY